MQKLIAKYHEMTIWKLIEDGNERAEFSPVGLTMDATRELKDALNNHDNQFVWGVAQGSNPVLFVKKAKVA